jgi:hypothetical protein
VAFDSLGGENRLIDAFSVVPKWNIQLQVTPTIPALIKKALF